MIIKEKKRNLGKDLNEFFDFIGNKFDSETADKFKDFVYTMADKGGVNNVFIVPPALGERTQYGGDLSGLYNLTDGVYNPERIPFNVMERMLQDPQIAIAFTMLTEPIKSLNFIIDCAKSNVKHLVEQAMMRIWDRFLSDTLKGIVYGFSIFEKVFKWQQLRVIDKSEGYSKVVFNDMVVIYDKLKNVHPSTVKIVLDERGNYNGFIQEVRGERITIPLEKSAIYTYNFEFGNYYGKSILRNVYKYWYWGELLYQFMLRYYENCGTPPVIVVVPKGKSMMATGETKDNVTLGLELGRSLLSNSVAVLPYEPHKVTNENQWDIKRMLDDKRGVMFVDAIIHINTMKLMGMFVPESVANQEVRERDVFFFTQEGLISSLENFINTQIIPPLIKYNYPNYEDLPCNLYFDRMSVSRSQMLKEVFIELIRSLRVLGRIGIVPKIYPDIYEIAEQLDIPLRNYQEIFNNENFVQADIKDGIDNDKKGKGISELEQDVQTDFDFDKTLFPKPTRGPDKKPRASRKKK